MYLPARSAKECFVGSSIQFLVNGLNATQIGSFIERCMAAGVELKWFGAPEPVAYTSRHDDWQYLVTQALPGTDKVLMRLCDMRIPMTFSLEDCACIGAIIAACLEEEHRLALFGGYDQ